MLFALQQITPNVATHVPALIAGITFDWTIRVDTLALAGAILLAALKLHRDWLQVTYAVNQMWADYCERKNIAFTPVAGLEIRQAHAAAANGAKNANR